MVEKLSSYRVTAALDATAYAAGMAQKVAADKAGAASAAQVSFAINETQKKVAQSGDVLTRLSRSYVEGFGQAERFARAVATLGRGMETGNVSMTQAEMILEGIYRKFGQVANATDLAEQGHYQLATAVTAVNAKLAAEDAALEVNTAAHQRNTAALRMANMQRTNLLFQLQDIGVSLAGGMNPLMVAMQQGSQISMIYGAGEGGLGRALQETANIAVGFATKFWPIAAVVAGVTAMIAAFTTEINRGQKVQVGFFDVVVAGWELVSEAVWRAISPIAGWFGGLWDDTAPVLVDIGNDIIATFVAAYNVVTSGWSNLPTVFSAIGKQAYNSLIAEFEKPLLTFGDQVIIPGMNLSGIKAQLTDVEKGAWQGTVGNAFDQDYIRGALGERARQVATRPSEKALKDAQKEADRQSEAYADLTRSSQQFVSDKQLEAQTLGMTTEAAARFRYEQEMLNKAANDNIALSPAQRSEIALLATQMAAAEEQTRQLTEAYELGKSTLGSFFSDFKSELMNGASLWGAFANAAANALQTIADKALEMAANGIWDMIFGAVMGGLTGGMGATGGTWGNGLWGSAIFNAKGNVFSSPGLHQYANSVVDRPTVFPFAKGIGLMGEAGPEAIMPLRRGPDGRLGVAAANSNVPAAGNDNRPLEIHNHIHVPAGTNPETAPAIAREVARELKMQLPDAIKNHDRNPLRRAGRRT